MAYFCYQFET